MKILINDNGHTIRLAIPTGLIFSKPGIRLAIGAAQIYAPEAMEEFSPEAVIRLCDELKRIKKKYGSWELVEIHSSDGEHVQILL